MALKVEIEYIETPDEAKRINKVASILGEGIYAYLKKEGLLKTDPQRKEKVREVMNTAREIINRDMPTDKIHAFRNKPSTDGAVSRRAVRRQDSEQIRPPL